MTYAPLQSLENAQELPIEQLYNNAVEAFKSNHAELAKLPQDPKDPLPALDSMLRSMGVECDNDMSFFMMGAMGKFGSEAITGAFGMAANVPLAMGADIATGMIAELSAQKKDDRPRFKRAETANDKKSVFTTRYAKAPVVAPRRQQSGATALLRGASLARKPGANVPNAEKKRNFLKGQMAERRREIEDLKALQSCGYKYAKRVSILDKQGNAKSMLIGIDGKPVPVAAPKTKTAQPENRNELQKRPGLGLGLAA